MKWLNLWSYRVQTYLVEQVQNLKQSNTMIIEPRPLATTHAWRLHIVLTAQVIKFRLDIDWNVLARNLGASARIDSEQSSTHLHQPAAR